MYPIIIKNDLLFRPSQKQWLRVGRGSDYTFHKSQTLRIYTQNLRCFTPNLSGIEWMKNTLHSMFSIGRGYTTAAHDNESISTVVCVTPNDLFELCERSEPPKLPTMGQGFGYIEPPLYIGSGSSFKDRLGSL